MYFVFVLSNVEGRMLQVAVKKLWQNTSDVA